MEVSLSQDIIKGTKVQGIGLKGNMVHINPVSLFLLG